MILIQQRNRTAWLASRVVSAKKEDKTHMKDLAKAFIGKECLVYTVNSQTLTGTVKEVTDGAILLQSENTHEAVNLDFIVRIREYPRNKKGKKKSVVID
jgi:hypothetical protein